ncbi:MAG: deoxyuridine 5'-triphosphate nucleotidohydrolase [Solobacterium sp.]|nr:deoxyuridine 5'-triphosphate nucleotidohydrolase [Solobacterium sp.]
MRRIAAFEKTGFAQFEKDLRSLYETMTEEEIRKIYDDLKLPVRATTGSAGYDFFAPYDIEILPGCEVLIPTGVRVRMEEDYVLLLFPRSGLGFKYRLQLNNTVGVIDSDYYHAENEGHIFCKLTNDSRENKTVLIHKGEGMVQGIFLPFGITEDDHASTLRTGGLGSTTKKAGKL